MLFASAGCARFVRRRAPTWQARRRRALLGALCGGKFSRRRSAVVHSAGSTHPDLNAPRVQRAARRYRQCCQSLPLPASRGVWRAGLHQATNLCVLFWQAWPRMLQAAAREHCTSHARELILNQAAAVKCGVGHAVHVRGLELED